MHRTRIDSNIKSGHSHLQFQIISNRNGLRPSFDTGVKYGRTLWSQLHSRCTIIVAKQSRFSSAIVPFHQRASILIQDINRAPSESDRTKRNFAHRRYTFPRCSSLTFQETIHSVSFGPLLIQFGRLCYSLNEIFPFFFFGDNFIISLLLNLASLYKIHNDFLFIFCDDKICIEIKFTAHETHDGFIRSLGTTPKSPSKNRITIFANAYSWLCPEAVIQVAVFSIGIYRYVFVCKNYG